MSTSQTGGQLERTSPAPEAVRRQIPGTNDVLAAALDQYFAGPSSEEQNRGLELTRNGFVGYRKVDFANGVVSVYLSGNCAPSGTGYSLARPLIATLRQFPGVLYVKLYDAYDHTGNDRSAADSWPTCLDVIFTLTPTASPSPTPTRTPSMTPTATLVPTNTPRPSATATPLPTRTLPSAEHGQPLAEPDAIADRHANAASERHQHAASNVDVDADAVAHCHLHADTQPYTYELGDGHTDSYAAADIHSDAHADSVDHTHGRTDVDAAPNAHANTDQRANTELHPAATPAAPAGPTPTLDACVQPCGVPGRCDDRGQCHTAAR